MAKVLAAWAEKKLYCSLPTQTIVFIRYLISGLLQGLKRAIHGFTSRLSTPLAKTTANKQPETSMNPNDTEQEKQTRDAKLAAARAKSEERRIAHAKLKQHMRDTAIPIRPQPDEHQ